MKSITNLFLLLSFSLVGCYSTGQMPENRDYSTRSNYNNNEVTYQTFYDELQPYGNWIDYPGYGYVWQPNAGSGFRPYETSGHWVSTVDGWAWASDYNWGWAPFHYGRWLNEPSIGWAWVPGYEWAPAWVTWGQSSNYYAWAPLAPGINIGFGNSWRAPNNYWSYVPNNCIQNRNLNRYIVRNNRNMSNNITIINNYNSYNNNNYYHRGPDYKSVEQYTRRVIRPVAIASTNKPGATRVDNKGKFEIYRPAVSQNTTNTTTQRPTKVISAGRVEDNNNRRPENNIFKSNSVNADNQAGVSATGEQNIRTNSTGTRASNQTGFTNPSAGEVNRRIPVQAQPAIDRVSEQNTVTAEESNTRKERARQLNIEARRAAMEARNNNRNENQQVQTLSGENNNEMNRQRQAQIQQRQQANEEAQAARRQANLQRNIDNQNERNARQQNAQILRQQERAERQQNRVTVPQRQPGASPQFSSPRPTVQKQVRPATK